MRQQGRAELINTCQGERALEGMVGLKNQGDKNTADLRNVRINALWRVPENASASRWLCKNGLEPGGRKLAG